MDQKVSFAPRARGGPIHLDAKRTQCGGGGVKISNLQLRMELTLLIGEEPEPVGPEVQQCKVPGMSNTTVAPGNCR